MKKAFNKLAAGIALTVLPFVALASSHREAPLISQDPLADNTDLYAFKSPCDPNKIVIIADWIPFEHPAGGPNWYTFGENIQYEIHIKNNPATPEDDILYRFVFNVTDEDPTTFFNIRLGKQNQKTTYKVQRRIGSGPYVVIATNGKVPPNNIGPRSIQSPVGLNKPDYESLIDSAVMTATTGERMFAGPADDPFFVDLGGAFDLGGFRPDSGRDGLARMNIQSICLEIPVETLQKDGKDLSQAANILDPEFVIGVWASTNRPKVTTLQADGSAPVASAQYVQVSRLGMPLTNEAVIPIGMKDQWNRQRPYGSADLVFAPYFTNPELALYMDSTAFAAAVPGLANLHHIQSASLGQFNFRNGQPGLFPLKNSAAVAGTALDDALFGTILLPDNMSPRAVDILPIFFTGVPNLAPYQLATGKAVGNPLSAGKPFINNFLPVLGDMLRLNMAVPATPRDDANFSSLGLVQAAVLGLTDPTYANTSIQFIPNMDGFPNGRRLEDDVTTIELQAVGGVVLAAIGLWYDDYTVGGSPLTPDLLEVLAFNAGVTKNDTTLKPCFPYVQAPWQSFTGEGYVGPTPTGMPSLGIAPPVGSLVAFPNPFVGDVTFRYNIAANAKVSLEVMDATGRMVQQVELGSQSAGQHNTTWNGARLPAGNYMAGLLVNGNRVATAKLTKKN